jgi:hypothetical protein
MATKQNAKGTVASTPATAPTEQVAVTTAAQIGGVAVGVRASTVGGLQTKLSAMAQGWSEVIPADVTLPTAGGTGYSESAVVSQLNGWLALFPPVVEAKVNYATAVAQLHQAEPAMRVQLSALELALKAYFGKGNPMLARFGIKPAKMPAKPSPATAAAAVQRRLNTRSLRNTMGPKQKAKVKFQGQLVTQVEAPAAGENAAPAAAAPAPADPVKSS